MPKLQVPEGISVNRQRVAIPQVNVSVTPEQLAGPEVRLLTELGKKADEITDFVVRRQNTKDLEIVTRADTAMKELLMEQKLAAEELKGMDASGLLTKQTTLFDGNFHPEDGQVLTDAHQRYLNIYQSADQRQQAAMDMQRSKQRITHLKAIGSYEEAQTSAAALDAHKANVQISVAKGIAGTEEERDAEISSIISQYDSIKALTGAEPETIMADQMKDISAIHMGRLKNLVDAKDITGAEEYFKKHKDEMIGDTSTIKNAIASRKVDVQSEVESDYAFKMWAKGDITKAYNYIDNIKDPDVQKGARLELEARIRNEQSDRTETVYRTNSLVNKSMFEKDDQGKYTVKSFADMPQDALSYLAGQPGGLTAVTQLKNFFAVRDNPSEPSTETQMKAYDLLTKMANSKNLTVRQAFLKTNIATSNVLGESLKKKFMDLQGEMMSKTSGSLMQKTDFLSAREGLFKLGDDGNERARFALQEQLARSVINAEAELKKKGEIRELSIPEYSELVKKVYEPGKVRQLLDKLYAPTPPKPGKQVQPIDAHIKDSIDLYKITDAEDKNRFTSNLMSAFDSIRDKNIADGKPSEPSWKQREALIKIAVNDKVRRDDTFSPDDEVISITLNDEEAETAYVETPGGNEVLLKEIDAVQGESLKRLDAYIVENNLTYSYKNRAAALEALGNKDVISRRRQSMTGGTFKTPDGKVMRKADVYEKFNRMTLEQLQNLSTEEMEKGFGREFIEVRNYVIREKARAAQ